MPPKANTWLATQGRGRFAWDNLTQAAAFLGEYGITYCDDYNGYLATFEGADTIVVLARQDGGGWQIATVDGERLNQRELRSLFDV